MNDLSETCIAYFSDYVRLVFNGGGFTHDVYASKWVSVEGSYADYLQRGGKLPRPLVR